ncbi:hypothetical protein C3F34_13990 [Acinetobacter sp. ACNIH2]|uniref:DUF1376 domain-containing protein n=1 Tax=Acinetobacter sp. ACNIH2 TaxID=1758189 RepID=UPI000CDC9841|nr:DUF1376 domain-containing protein [Acinetobacter sp. ACNIH2]AUX87033.1 hypothetical protein C3F34_13990 [Acinetobacter sp. ACNIH2]
MSNQEVEIWMPIYIGDILAKTTRMTTEQIGASFLLMMDYWRNGAIPDDNNVIASVIRMSVTKAKALKLILVNSNLFEVNDGQMSSKYLDGLKNQAEINKSSKSERAKKAAEARWNKENGDATTGHKNSNAQASNEHDPSNANAYAQAMHEDAPSNAYAMLEECPSSSPSSINNISLTHEQNSAASKPEIEDRFSFDLETANTRIKLRGLKEITQDELNKLLDDLRAEYGHKTQMVKNQILGKLVQWVERRQQTPLASHDNPQGRPRNKSQSQNLNVNDDWNNQPKNDQPFHGTVQLPEGMI